MKDYKGIKIIGVDHGYGNIKTANTCFPTGVLSSNLEPVFTTDLLIWNGKYHSIGVGHKEFIADKFLDDDYYILTLAAIARELRRERIVEAKVHLAVGLPLTWLSSQKEDFKKYLMKNSKVKFVFRAVEYSIEFVGIDIFPQGFPAALRSSFPRCLPPGFYIPLSLRGGRSPTRQSPPVFRNLNGIATPV